MYNWRLLLLAFFAVFQPSASFTDRNLVDGRHQCCDHRLERDSSYSLYGNSRLKLPSEDFRVTRQDREIRKESRDERRYENSALSRLAGNSVGGSNVRENRRSVESRSQFSRIEFQREREDHAQIRNGMVFEERATTRDLLRNTRTDRHRIAANRRNLVFNSRIYQIKRETRSRAIRDVFENTNQPDERIMISSRDTRQMQTHIDRTYRNRENRETRVELRRMSDALVLTERSNIHQNRRVEREQYQRRASQSHFERNERSVRSLDETSRDSNRLLQVGDNTEARNVRAQSGDRYRNNNERKSIEMRFRERLEIERKVTRSTTEPRQVDSNRARRSVSRAFRRENEFRVYSNIGDRAYEVDNLRNNIRMREERDRETTTPRAEPRITENNHRLLDSRERVTRSVTTDKIPTSLRVSRERSRENARDRLEIRIIDSRRINVGHSYAIQERRDENEHQYHVRVQKRISSEERPARDILRLMDAARKTSSYSHRLSSGMNEREIVQAQRDVRNNERMEIRSVDRTRLAKDELSTRRIESRTTNVRQIRKRATSESDRLSSRINDREIARRDTRDNERMEIRNTEPTKEASRNNGSSRRLESRPLINERFTSKSSDRSSLKRNDREIVRARLDVRDNERREIRNADQIRVASTDNISMRLVESRITNIRQSRERATSESSVLSRRVIDRELARDRRNERDNERNEVRNVDRLKETARNNISMRRIQRSTTNERRSRDRATSESYNLSSRTSQREKTLDRPDVRDNERNEICNVERRNEVSRNNILMRRIESRTSNERQRTDRATSELSRSSLNDREIARDRRDERDNERRETRYSDLTRESSRQTILERRTESQTVNVRQSRVRVTSDFNRFSPKVNDGENARDRDAVRTRDVSRENHLSRRTERRTTNERQHRERPIEFNRLPANDREIASDRKVRNNERMETRNQERGRDVSRENGLSRRIESRNRLDVDSTRNHVATLNQKNTETQANEYSWEYLIYTLQFIYLCSIFMPMTLAKNNNLKTKNAGWWAPIQNVIKMD